MTASSLLQQASAEREALVASVLPRAVAIAVSRRRVLSGIRWSGSLVVTAAEAVAGADRIRLSSPEDGGSDASSATVEADGEVLAVDLATDVAVIRPSAAFPAAAGARPPAVASARADLRLGESVVIVGHDARGPIFAGGIVSVAGPAWRSRRGGDIARRLEFAAQVDDRLEGALVADTAGRVAAMLVSGPRGRALGIPTATIERVVEAVEHHGYLPRPYLGVRLQTLWLDAPTVARLARRARRIPVVAGVEIGSPAASAGLEPGDLIETLGGEEMAGVDDVMRALARVAIGSAVEVRLRRGGVSETRTITAGEQPRPAA
jgi:S1-C subfamily serine protease